jgi:hypothetical protein
MSRVEVITRFETHIDWKLERTPAVLVRLWKLRRPVVPAWFVWHFAVTAWTVGTCAHNGPCSICVAEHHLPNGSTRVLSRRACSSYELC